jgi:hypothetical protein
VPNLHAPLAISIPGNSLKIDGIFRGFSLLDHSGIRRRLPNLTDQVLIQWLRYPWSISVSGDAPSPGDSSPKSPSVNRERESWDMHAIMTGRITEFLMKGTIAGGEGRWEYTSTQGPLDTPVYAQLVVGLCDMETRIGGRRICGIDGFEFRSHCHNLPTMNSKDLIPKLNLSFWTSWIQDPLKGLFLDITPDVHIPILLQLVGSPSDADPTSAVITGLVGSDIQPSLEKSSSPTLTAVGPPIEKSGLEKFLDQIDLGFRVTLVGVVGKASGFTFASSKISLFKEEDRGRGMILAEIRDMQVAMCSSSTIEEAVQPLHSRVCLGVPAWKGVASEDLEVFPLIAVKQTMVHIGLGGGEGEVGDGGVFCNIQGGRVWWSPSLNRGMRVSLDRTDKTVEMISRWKMRFTNELLARMGKSRRQKKQLESIMNFLDMLIPSNGQIKLILRCADIQVSCHNVQNDTDDLLASSGSSVGGRVSSPDVPKHFQPFRGDGGSYSPRPLTPESPQTPVAKAVIFGSCSCMQNQTSISNHVVEMENFLQHIPHNLEIPKICTWWTRSGHLKGCSLPPLPLPFFFSPPNTRRERAIGAVKFQVWLSDCHTRATGAPSLTGPSMTPAPLSPVSTAWMPPIATPASTVSRGGSGAGGGSKPKPRGSQLVMSSRESIFEVTIIRTKTPSNLRVNFNASFNSIQGSVAPTALRGLVWLGQSGQNILRPVLSIQRISLILTTDLFPLKSAKTRLLIPRIALSADDDAFHLVIDVFRNCVLYRGSLIDPNGGRTGVRKPAPGGPSVGRIKNLAPGKREMIIESLLKSLAVADASLTTSTDDLSAEYIVETVSVNLTHRQRCFIQIQIFSLAGKHAFSISHPHRPMVFSVQVGDIKIVSGGSIGGPSPAGVSVFVPSSSTQIGSGGHTVLRSAASGSPSAGNLITVRGNDRYITLNNREWHVYDTLFLSTAPVVVDVTQELIEELYLFVFPPQGTADSTSSAVPGSTLRRLPSSNFPGTQTGSPTSGRVDSFLLDNQQVEVVGNKLLTGRNKQRISAGRQNSPPPPSVMSSDIAPKTPLSPGVTGGIQRGLSPPGDGRVAPGQSAASSQNGPHGTVSELIFFKFVRFSNIDLIVTFKGKQFSLNNLSLTLKYYLRRRKLATWKEFFDEWGSKVGKQAFGSFVKHGFTRKRGIQDIIVGKLNNLTNSEKDVDKMLFGKFAPKS